MFVGKEGAYTIENLSDAHYRVGSWPCPQTID